MDEINKKIEDYIEHLRGELLDVDQYIFNNPEVGFQENKASQKLMEVLKKYGFKVDHPIGGMDTAFQASISNQAESPHIAILAEYDALPDLGHACGHNLIATVALGAALALAHIMPYTKGRVSIIGTPAEEVLSNSGKMRLVAAGSFKKIDAALIAHPHGKTWLCKPFLATDEIYVQFSGKSSHAASAPEIGVNAYDAMQLTFTALSFLRQQLRQDTRVHWGDLKVSGAKNVIPPASSATITVRSLDEEYTSETRKKVINCIRGAALMTGCKADFQISEGCRSMKYNKFLTNIFGENAKHLGLSIDDLPIHSRAASTDMGNVSQVVPSIHPFFKIKEGVVPHTPEFREASISDIAFEAAIKTAKAIAMTAIAVFMSPVNLKQAKDEFEKA
jgi:amidohydrolase